MVNALHFIASSQLYIIEHFRDHSAGKHDRGPLFFTLFLFRLIRSRSTGSI